MRHFNKVSSTSFIGDEEWDLLASILDSLEIEFDANPNENLVIFLSRKMVRRS